MKDSRTSSPFSLSIASVERDTGLPKDTLRVWERRYGFPQPGRDAYGERVYSREEVEKLRLVKRLLDAGHRPGKIIGQDIDQLKILAEGIANPGIPCEPAGQERPDLLHYIALCKDCRFDELRRALSQEALRLGMYRFVVDVIAPLNTLVGARWANGEFAIFEEHLYTESVQIVMRNAIASIPQPNAGSEPRPRVLLTTLPQEQHSLGLLMAEAVLALEGARCISLGVQTPMADIARAAETQHADIVALSFSPAMQPNSVLDGLKDLLAVLPEQIEVWAGGTCAALHRRPPENVRVLGLHDVGAALGEWRARRLP